MSTIAYRLRADYDGTVEQDGIEVPIFTGGLIAAGDRDVDVRVELDAGAGTIVVAETDSALVEALDSYPALKRVGAPDDATPVDPYAGLTVVQLRDEVRLRELTVPAGAKRGELVDALLADDQGADITPDPDSPEA